MFCTFSAWGASRSYFWQCQGIWWPSIIFLTRRISEEFATFFIFTAEMLLNCYIRNRNPLHFYRHVKSLAALFPTAWCEHFTSAYRTGCAALHFLQICSSGDPRDMRKKEGNSVEDKYIYWRKRQNTQIGHARKNDWRKIGKWMPQTV